MADVLTEKQEAFAVHYVVTANAAAAYRNAYNVAEDARDDWIYVEAAQLLDHPKIGPRIKELQDKAKERSEYTVLRALEELEEARVMAHGEAQASAAVSAVNGKIKLLGLDKAQSFVHKHTGAINVKTSADLSDDELAVIAAGGGAGTSAEAKG